MLRRSILFLAAIFVCAEEAGAERNEKISLTTALVRRNGLSQAQAQEQVDRVFTALRAELKAGSNVEVRNFGSFSIRERAVRRKKTAGPAAPQEKKKYPHFASAEILKLELNARKRID